jgi:iron-sulfur cluster assembly protein
MLDFSQEAIDEIELQIIKHNIPDTKLRIGIRGGGCSGFSYVIEFHEGIPLENDYLFNRQTSDGTYISILVDKKSISFLENAYLTWENTLLHKGFKFINPNVESTCGCGLSFSI